MRTDIVELHTRTQVVVLGRDPLLFDMAKGAPQPFHIHQFRAELGNASLMGQLRAYLSRSGAFGVDARVSDADMLRRLEQQIEGKRLVAICLPTPTASALKAGVAISGASAPSPKDLTTPSMDWILGRRISEVLGKTATKLPKSFRDSFVALLSPDSIALMVATVVFVEAANLTPFGWAADIVLLGLAYSFGGLAALSALRDLMAGIMLVGRAETQADLDAASDAFARAVTTLGILGLLALLHQLQKGKPAPPTKIVPLTVSLVEKRMAKALAFLERSNVGRAKINEVMGAIDFEKEVEVVTLDPGTPLYRLSVVGDSKGSWYTDATSYTADQRAISSFGEADLSYDPVKDEVYSDYDETDFRGAPPRKILPRIKRKVEVEHVVNRPTEMLKSTAKGIPDTWSLQIRAHAIRTHGGAVQYYVKNFDGIR